MNSLNDEQLNRLYDRIEQLEKENEKLKEGKHARWHVIDYGSEGDEAFCHYWATLKCSRCGMERETEDGYIPNYCEECGAKMDEEKESNND